MRLHKIEICDCPDVSFLHCQCAHLDWRKSNAIPAQAHDWEAFNTWNNKEKEKNMITITRVPVPEPPKPPATYTIEGLTEEQMWMLAALSGKLIGADKVAGGGLFWSLDKAGFESKSEKNPFLVSLTKIYVSRKGV